MNSGFKTNAGAVYQYVRFDRTAGAVADVKLVAVYAHGKYYYTMLAKSQATVFQGFISA
jgi:hypothetical protein